MGNEFVTINVQGLDQLQEALEAAKIKVAKRGLRAALKAGATIIKNAIVSGAPKDTGFLSEHFNIKISIMRNELAGSAFIGPAGKVDYPAFASGAYKIKRVAGKAKRVGRIAVATVARWLEFGTSKMAKFPFMTSGFESNKDAALTAIADKLRDSLGL